MFDRVAEPDPLAQKDIGMAGKTIRIISNTVYIIGVVCVLFLIILIFFGDAIFPHEYDDPNFMVPVYFSAMLWLMFGTVPMVGACTAVYIFNGIKNRKHKIRNFILVFSPGFICVIVSLYLIFTWLIPVLVNVVF